MTPRRFSKILVIFCIAHLWTFTYVCILLAALGVSIPPEIIIGNFAFFGTELASLLVIKICRLKKEV